MSRSSAEVVNLVQRAQKFVNYGQRNSGFGKAILVTVTSATETELQAEFQVNEELTNVYGSLHGGATATVIDTVSSCGMALKPGIRWGVTINLNINYLKPVQVGEWVTMESKTLRVGKTLAHLGIKLKKKEDGSLIAFGTHVKYLTD